MFEQDFVETKEGRQPPFSRDDQAFLKRMKDGLTKRGDGHYELPLPVREGTDALPNNKGVIMKRLHGLRNKLKRDENLREQYTACMQDTISKGYAEEVPANELSLNNGMVWYIPHHGVKHPWKKKLRVVFDCSTEYKGRVLNSHLLSGPDLSNSLTGILCRFRKDAVAFCCDIEAMFSQVHVREEDRNYLRFLWWKGGNLDGPVVEYRMTTHLFGATSSPGCAMFALRAAANERGAVEEAAAEFIQEDFYIDDGLTSVQDSTTAIKLIDHSKRICADAGFRLCKYSSNSTAVMQAVSAADRQPIVKTDEDFSGQKTDEQIVLGLLWDPEADAFRFNVKLPTRGLTRRGVLSMTSSIFDPFGLISPFVLIAKRILQDLCRDGLTWDDPLPEEARQRWTSWEADTSVLTQVEIPRCLKTKELGQTMRAELHNFSDASTVGYGECTYLRLIDYDNNVSCQLVMSKSRVTPTKTITIPRLELTAAVTAVKISEFLKDELKIPDLHTVFWTDSKVVLGYVTNETKRFHVFVANRVQYIRDHSSPEQWRYIGTNQNPADFASRGLRAQELIDNALWWHGPPFFQRAAEPQLEQPTCELSSDDPEVRKKPEQSVTSHYSSVDEERDAPPSLVDRIAYFSSWHRAKLAVANCLKYKRILKSHCFGRVNCDDRRVTLKDLENAEKLIIKEVQQQNFSGESKALEALNRSRTAEPDTPKVSLKRKSAIGTLDPFLDRDGLIRVVGRLGRAALPPETVHPVILPRSRHVTNLVIGHHHEGTAHSGRGFTLNEIRASGYWIVGGRGAVARYIWRCVQCRKLRRNPMCQKMAELPLDRVEAEGPFTYSAVDLFGRYFMRERRSEVKRWAVIFVCMSSRAVHIETANSLDTDSLLNAFRRFTCRRGPVRQLRCDQGTNFIGGKNEFLKAYEEMDQAKIEQDLLKRNCDLVRFEFNVPHASHMGGSWERLIRCARTALSSLLTKAGRQLDDESLRTLLTEVESLINSRPLTTTDMTDSDTVQPLSPSMLLTMKSSVLLPPPGSFLTPDLYCRRRWRRVQHLLDLFWQRWQREFLLSQQRRQKWTHTDDNVQSGDIVLVVDDNTPRSQWKMGRVISTYPSSDELVRKVRVAIGSSEYDRPIHRLVLLMRCSAESRRGNQ